MPAQRITYLNKNNVSPEGSIERTFFAQDANEIKIVINSHADDLDSLSDNKADLIGGFVDPTQLPPGISLGIIEPTENTISNFVFNQGNYTFGNGNIVSITSADGEELGYYYNGGDRGLLSSYDPVSFINSKLSKSGGSVTGSLEVQGNLDLQSGFNLASGVTQVTGEGQNLDFNMLAGVDFNTSVTISDSLLIGYTMPIFQENFGHTSTEFNAPASGGISVVANVFDMYKTTAAAADATYTAVIRSEYSGSDNFDFFGALQVRGDHSGSADLQVLEGFGVRSDHRGAGNVEFITNRFGSRILETGAATANIVRAISPFAVLDNPNASVNYIQGSHPNVTLNAGTVNNDVDIVHLDLDVNTANLANITVGGNISYLHTLTNPDVQQLTAGGKIRFIWNESPFESDFNGIINVLNDISDIENATNKVLITKEYADTYYAATGGSVDAGTLDGLDSLDFVRTTGNVTQDVTGDKSFLNNLFVGYNTQTSFQENFGNVQSTYNVNGTVASSLIDVTKTTGLVADRTYAQAIRLEYTGSDTIANLSGIDLRVTHSGTGDVTPTFLQGIDSTVELTGSGTVAGSTNILRSRLTGTGVYNVTGALRGAEILSILDNDNATVNFLTGEVSVIELNGGTVTNDVDIHLASISADSSNFANITVNGDISYFRGLSNLDLELLPIAGKKRFIWNETNFESDFNGIINVLNPLSDIQNATNKVLVTKEFTDASYLSSTGDVQIDGRLGVGVAPTLGSIHVQETNYEGSVFYARSLGATNNPLFSIELSESQNEVTFLASGSIIPNYVFQMGANERFTLTQSSAQFDFGRTIDLQSGQILLGGNTGGWTTGYKFLGSEGTDLGGFQAFGGTDALNYYYIGSDHLNPIASFNNTTGATLIGYTTPTLQERFGHSIEFNTPSPSAGEEIYANVFDTRKTSGVAGDDTRGVLAKMTYSGSDDIADARALYGHALYDGVGATINQVIGLVGLSDYQGAGNVGELYPILGARIEGTGAGNVTRARGLYTVSILDNPNTTVDFIQGIHPTVDIREGTVNGELTVAFLDIDIDAANYANININGDLTYLQGGGGTDVENLVVAGKKRFIWNQGSFESDFNGIINVLNDVSDIEAATNKVLITKEYAEANFVTTSLPATVQDIEGIKRFNNIALFTNDLTMLGNRTFRYQIDDGGGYTNRRLQLETDGNGNIIFNSMFSSGGASDLIFSFGNVEQIRFQTNGQLNLNNTLTTQDISVGGNITADNTTYRLNIPDDVGYTNRRLLIQPDGAGNFDINSTFSSGGSGELRFKTANTTRAAFLNGGTFRMYSTLDATDQTIIGNVLQIQGTNTGTINSTSSAMDHFLNTTVRGFRFLNNNGTLLDISNSGNLISLGNITSTSFIRTGGNSSEFLKADGSVDSNTYQVRGNYSIQADKTGGYTVVSTDVGEVISFTNSGAINVTVNQSSLSNIGDTTYLDARGTGTVTVVAGAGVTLEVNVNKNPISDGQYSRIAVQKMSSTNYRVFGEIQSI